ncbi:MAG: choice-of-anchor D domain-containing protein [Myxococcaceae bacterium]|nr:choice-of-anchor D domain-containing protein [Myxococcaceae bacterium]
MKRLTRGVPALLAVLLGVCAASCRPPNAQTVRPELVPPELTQDFGAVPVLNEKTLEVPLLNSGRVFLTVSNVAIKEPSSAFSVKTPVDQVEPAVTKPIVVAFVPPTEADYEGTLVFDTDDENYPHVEVKLKGKGSTRAIVEVDPPAIDFGRVAECSTAVRTFTIRSAGSADLVVNDISFTADSSSQFTFVGSTRTPVVVKTMGSNGLPGQIQITVKYAVAAGSTTGATGTVKLSTTDPDKREVLIPITSEINRAPVPSIAALGNGAPGLEVALDGSASMDPDGDNPITYKWTLRSKPLSSTTVIAAPELATTSMRLDPLLPGAYEVQLDVTDSEGAKSCQPARATVVAAPAQKLLVEMFWDHAKTDIDLHVLRTPDAMVGKAPDDCHYANPAPDWGMPGTMDDPQLLRDALTGYGPELFGYVNPIDTTYRVVADFAHDHLDPNPASTVTVRIYLYGVVKGEFTKRLDTRGTRWAVADIAWPSGVITPVP